MEIIAHRGASHDAPENTLAAIHLAWQQRADAVEVDVHLSKDGHVVVIHDDNTRKTAGVRKKVRDQTLAQLKTLDAGRWKDRRWAGEKIPTLAEVLATVPNGKRLFVEIKCGPEVITAFAETLRQSGRKPSQVVPIGFSLPTMRLLKEELPALEVCLVAAFTRPLPRRWRPTAEELIRQARDARLDGLDLGARGPLNAAFAETIKAAGLKLYVWTVDSPAKAKQLAAAGVDALTTNRPGPMREALHRFNASPL